MGLRESFRRVLDEYPKAMKQPFAGNDLAGFLRKGLPDEIRKSAEISTDYLIEGSAGHGQWARSPWVAVFDPLVTNSAQRGYYPVYLFREDFTGLYLSLNQGVTDVRQKYGAEVKSALQARAADYRARLGQASQQFPERVLDLRPSSPFSYSADYEAGNIYAKFYDAASLPSDSIFVQDLSEMLRIYDTLSYKENIPSGTIGVEEDEQDNLLIEDYAAVRQHKRIERNPALAVKVKKIHGYTCQACGFNFEEVYVGIKQRKYIEAHHLIPVSMLKGKKVSRNPKTDFAVLCANCHRMIHRFESPWDIQAFRQAIQRKISKTGPS